MDQQPNYEPYGENFSYLNSTGFESTANYMDQSPTPQQLHQHMNGNKHDPPLDIPLQVYEPTILQPTVSNSSMETNYISQQLPSLYQHEPPITLVQAATMIPQTTELDMSHCPPVSSLNYHPMSMATPNQTDLSQKPMESSFDEPDSPLPQITQPSIIHQETTAEQPATVPQEVASEGDINTLQNQSEEQKPRTTKSSCIFNPEQNSFMMKALGVVRKEVLTKSGRSQKRRRRIVQLNDDDDSENERMKRELLNKSPELTADKGKPSNGKTEDSSSHSESDDEQDPSTITDPQAIKQYKARSLLKNVVIIQGPSNKKKKRVLESDDEDEMLTSVDDIGLEATTSIENEEESFVEDILVSDVFVPIECEQIEIIVDEPPPIPKDEGLVPTDKTEADTKEIEEKTAEMEDSTAAIKNEQSVVDEINEIKKVIKTEDGSETDPSALSVEAILENIKPMADDDEFFKFDKSSDDDVQFVPNDEYFGTPDNKVNTSSKKRRRGPAPGMKRKSTGGNRGPQKRGDKYEKDFVSGSSESDYTYSESSTSTSESSEDEVQHTKIVPKKAPIIVRTPNFTVTKVPIKKKTAKDRFYDKSRDIPNDIYFGDVKVPLHVLHTQWDCEVISSDSSTENPDPDRFHYSQVKPNFNRGYQSSSSGSGKFSKSYSCVEPSEDPKLFTLKHFAKVSGIKINYGRLFDGIRSTDDKCMLIRRILAQKGLQGEPTIAKCKQLKLDLQTKREIAELDTSVIIRSEGRTRRTTRNAASSKSPSKSASAVIVQPKTLQTLSSLKRLIDSDSD